MVRQDKNLVYGEPSNFFQGTCTDEVVWVCKDGIEMRTSKMNQKQIHVITLSLEGRMRNATGQLQRIIQTENLPMHTKSPQDYMDDDVKENYLAQRAIIEKYQPFLQKLMKLAKP